MRLLVLEDEPHWQKVIEDIAAAGKLEIVRVCANLADGLAAIKADAFDVLIADLGLPDGTGIDAIRMARRTRPEADVLVATVFADEKSVVSAIYAGAAGYILKDSTPDEWMTALADLRAGHSPLSPKIARYILRRLQEPARVRKLGEIEAPQPPKSDVVTDGTEQPLSSRETEVLQLVAKGFSLVEVARILHVSHTTTRTHARNIYRKLEVNSRGEAVFEASRLGLL